MKRGLRVYATATMARARLRLRGRASRCVAARAVESDGLAQPFLEVDDRRVAQQASSPGQLRDRIAHLSGPSLGVHRRERNARQPADVLPQLVHAHALAASDVEHLPRHIRGGSSGREQVGVHDVRDEHEIPRLFAVAEDRGRLPGQGGGDEARHDRRVLRVRVLPGPEDVEIAQYDRLQPVGRLARDAVVLARELGGRVRRQRPGHVLLRVRQCGGVSVRRRGPGVHHAAHALVPGREQHVQRAGRVHLVCHDRLVHRSLDRRDRGVMQHAIDALDGAAAGVQVRDAAADEAYLTSHRREVRPATGRQVVQHRDVVSRSDEVLHQVRADEARTPSDQIAHVISLGSAWSLPLAGIRPARPDTYPATRSLCGAPPRLWRPRHRCLSPTSPRSLTERTSRRWCSRHVVHIFTQRRSNGVGGRGARARP